ncbi:MAG: sulfotransferase, partial [Acidobacteriota bacterium]|nr:sulfotransferase [Acidobacteriota bacterium]
MPAALFIVGTSRSGTSWVFDLCASHPDMSMGYESKLPVEGIELHRRFADRLRRPAEREAAMAELFAALHDTIDDPSNAELFERLADPEVIGRAVSAYGLEPGWPAVCETIFCSLESTSHWGNKLLRIELTEVLLEQWPDAK